MMLVRQAEDEAGGVVAVKALSLRRMAGWKALELFEREAATLKGLAHPAVPRYVDYFEQDNERDRGFFLVQVRAGRGAGGTRVHAEHTCCYSYIAAVPLASALRAAAP